MPTKYTASYEGVTHRRTSARTYTHVVIRCTDGKPSTESSHASWCGSEELAAARKKTLDGYQRKFAARDAEYVPDTFVIVPATVAS